MWRNIFQGNDTDIFNPLLNCAIRPIGLLKHIGLRVSDRIIEEAPYCYENVLWFMDARFQKKCKKCPNIDTRCNNCENKFDGEVLLVTDFETEFIMNKISCFVKNFTGYGYFIGGLLSLENGNLNKIKK